MTASIWRRPDDPLSPDEVEAVEAQLARVENALATTDALLEMSRGERRVLGERRSRDELLAARAKIAEGVETWRDVLRRGTQDAKPSSEA